MVRGAKPNPIIHIHMSKPATLLKEKSFFIVNGKPISTCRKEICFISRQEKSTRSRWFPQWQDWLTASCLLYTSDAADEEDSVDLGGRRIIKKKKKNYKKNNK